jgi:hypothetical protein
MNRTIKNLEAMLREAEAHKEWGVIEVTLKDGEAILIKKTVQYLAHEDYPRGNRSGTR